MIRGSLTEAAKRRAPLQFADVEAPLAPCLCGCARHAQDAETLPLAVLLYGVYGRLGARWLTYCGRGS